MQHLRVALYVLTGGTTDQVIELARSPGGMAEVFQQQPGFIAYGIGVTDDEILLSISLWDSTEQADAATQVAAEWVEEHIADRVELQDDFVADLAFLLQAGPMLAG